MRIAQIKRSDLPAAKRIIATVVLEYYFDGRYTPDELLARYEKSGYLADIDRLEEEYDGHHGLFLGAFEHDALVGTGGVRWLGDATGELVRLWLLRDFRGRGIGREITGTLIRFAQSAGWKRLRLDTSYRCKEAVALFQSVGFYEVTPYKESIGDCFMELDLLKVPNQVTPPCTSLRSSNFNAAVEKIATSIDDLRARWRVPGITVGVSCRGEDRFYCSGLADVEGEKLFTAETVIPVASVTKSFVADAASALVQKGILDWDTPVTQYIKDIQFADAEIQAKASLADFLSMRTGLDGYQEWQGIDCNTPNQLKEFISKVPRTGVFRESYIYSGLSVAFAAMVLQEVSGKSWTETLETEVFRPNGMKDYAFSWKNAVETLPTAKGYRPTESGWDEMTLTPYEQQLVRADGTLCLSTQDLLKWTKILPTHEGFQKMITPHVLTHFPDVPLDFWPESYGLCWGRRNYRGHAMAYHRGSEKGFRTVVAILPESDLSIVILSNGDRNLLIHLSLNHLLDALLGHSYIPWEPVFEAYRKQTMGS